MEKDKKEVRDILPSSGIWTVEDFAIYYGMQTATAIEKLSQMGVKILSFSRLYKHKLFRMDDLK